MTRKRCELYRIKQMDEPYSDEVKSRIAGIEPRDYTRMGVTIRHLTNLLNDVSARTRLLITLSDGKPDDYDGYRGEYGIEDTRQALTEAKQAGIHPFCITIDQQAPSTFHTCTEPSTTPSLTTFDNCRYGSRRLPPTHGLGSMLFLTSFSALAKKI